MFWWLNVTKNDCSNEGVEDDDDEMRLYFLLFHKRFSMISSKHI